MLIFKILYSLLMIENTVQGRTQKLLIITVNFIIKLSNWVLELLSLCDVHRHLFCSKSESLIYYCKIGDTCILLLNLGLICWMKTFEALSNRMNKANLINHSSTGKCFDSLSLQSNGLSFHYRILKDYNFIVFGLFEIKLYCGNPAGCCCYRLFFTYLLDNCPLNLHFILMILISI